MKTQPRTTLRTERLEDRCVPALFGNPWPDAQNLTVSFAKEDTSLGSLFGKSKLFSEMQSVGSEAVWQAEAMSAFQAWLAPTNININVQHDSGDAFGLPGPVQGSAKYGDIRIGSRSLSTQEVASATPFDLLGANVGDIFLNSNLTFSKTGAAGTYHLRTVLLQEIGHALGLPNSADPASVMYTSYQGARAGLSAGDVAAVQALYGARSPDRFDKAAPTDAIAGAKAISMVMNGDQSLAYDRTSPANPALADADLAAGDVDFYKVTLPTSLGDDFKVELRTSGLSLLTAKVSVVNAAGAVLASTSSAGPRAGDLSLKINKDNLKSYQGKDIYVRVEALGGAAYGVGRYKLAVGKEPEKVVYPSIDPNKWNPDYDTNNTFAAATDLGTQTASPDSRWEGTVQASIESDRDKDFYKFRTPAVMDSTVAVFSAWSNTTGKLDPIVRVYDAAGQRMAAEVITNDSASYTVQVRGVLANTAYVVEVAATDPQSSYKEGSYTAGFDLRATPQELPTLAAGTLTNTAAQEVSTFTADGNRSYFFELGATSATASAAAQLTIYNGYGLAVGTVKALANQKATLSLRLSPGTYTVRVSSGHQTGGAYALNYTLKGIFRDDPLGPKLTDTSTTLIGSPTPAPTPTPTPTPVVTKVQDPAPTRSWWSWDDAYSDPWAGM